VGGLVAKLGNPPENILICSGTLIAPDVFLTAGHCVSFLPVPSGAAGARVWVTFDSQFDPATSQLFPGTAHVNPGYNFGRADPGDIAIVKLDAPVAGVPPAQLPSLGYLDSLATSKQLKNAVFTGVGYGALREFKQGGPHSLYPSGDTRFYSYSSFLSLTTAWLNLSQNPATGNGGTCYGDSGGPNFYGATSIIAALTVTGDRFCRATNLTYRLDTPVARKFLGDWVTLP
jgi:Trypsin